MDISLQGVIITVLSILGSAGAFKFYERKLLLKQKNEDFLKNDCKERITKLETLLERSSEEKAELRNTILSLTAQVSELKIKVEFLESAKISIDTETTKTKKSKPRKKTKLEK